MTTISRDQLVENGWRFRLENFAAGASGRDWIKYEWLVAVAQAVQAMVERGNARVILNAPPRHGKSELLAHWLPSWFLDWYPERHVILGSHGDDFASDWGLKVRNDFELNKRMRTRVSPFRRRNNDWQTTEGGGMRSMGVGGSVVGRGGDLIVVTDPHKSWKETQSPARRQEVWDWFNADVYSRLEPGASIVVEHTRWHERDLTGYLLEEHEDGWVHIRLPALAEDDDLLDRPAGAALCEERFTKERLEKIKVIIGSFMFACLYQQRAMPLAGGHIQRDWFRRWTPRDLPAKFDERLQSWDMAFKDLKTSSYVVGQAWGRAGAKYYLLDQWRERLSFVNTIKRVKAFSARHSDILEKLIEDKANGPAVICALEEEVPGLIAVNPQGSKESRLIAVSPLIEAGNVYIPDRSVASWVDDFVEEVVNFPAAANDDQVDAMTMALQRMAQHTTASFDIVIPDSGTRSSPWEFIHARPQ
jgi:predicted phage terminase large subunit-like protein